MGYVSKEGEPLNEERWVWRVAYKDDSTLSQFDRETETYHYFGEIDNDKVVSFSMLHPETGREYKLEVPEGAKLIHFYDNIVQAPIGGTAISHRLYCFGYELGKTKKILSILPNDFIVESDPNKIGVL